VSTNLTLIVVATSVLHVAALVVMIWIRVRRTEGDGKPLVNEKITPCAVCGEPSAQWSYDGLDPNERRDPHTGEAWSPDMTHYRPVCATHSVIQRRPSPSIQSKYESGSNGRGSGVTCTASA
jgi:hypothetical protein